MQAVLTALLGTEDPPTNYGLILDDVAAIACCYDWESRVDESNWSGDTGYETLAEMVTAEPAGFLADISRFYGDDYYLDSEMDMETPMTIQDLAKDREAFQAWSETASGCDWCCGGGDEWAERLEKGRTALGFSTWEGLREALKSLPEALESPPEADVPENCPTCGHTIGEDRGDPDDYDDSMDGDHESALESVYGPND